jgi:outer membrane protein assembly factor BamB/dienelactone hydrolase
MTVTKKVLLAVLVFLGSPLSPVRAEDWPFWRGPRGDGISGEREAPVRFGPRENVAWRVETPGIGHSSPIIWRDALFLTSAVGEGDEARRVLLRYDRQNGRQVWEREVLRAPLEKKHQENSRASGTPATDGERVYLAFFGKGRVEMAALSFDGEILWRNSPCGFSSVHGFCSSPILHQDLVMVNCDQDSSEAAIYGLERSTGKVRWRAERENGVRSYVTPLIVPIGGEPRLFISGSKTVAAYDPADGRRIWVCDGPTEQCVASPVYGHGLLYITGGFPDRHLLAIRPDGKGDVTRTHIAWHAEKGVSYVPSPLLLGDRLYLVHDESGVVSCYDPRNGSLLWQERLGGTFKSSLAYAAGNIYASSEEGEVHVFKPGPRFERVAQNSMGERIFASPVFSGGHLYLRTEKALYALGSPASPPAAALAAAFSGGGSETPRGAPETGADNFAVLDPPALPPDSRLGKPVDLNGYFPWKPITDPKAWKERARWVRLQLLVSAGLWPMEAKREPVKPVIHGAIDRGDYTIEKVYFQSYPGFYVTGNLYRPKDGKSGRRPAVLSPHGHWQNGRFCERTPKEAEEQVKQEKEKTLESATYHLQARCAALARLGCVVFHYDMVGYADSQQFPHNEGFRDAEAELRLQSTFGLQTFNSIRSLDFLSSLRDVDPARIGVTGASGGGTQTFILCAIDERPAAAFPAVMVSTAMQGGCVCENGSYLRVGSGNIEIAALIAPRPLGMTGADDWTKEIETKGLPELKAIYAALGAPDLVSARCFPQFEHNYNQVSRELMYSFMNRSLGLNQPEPIAERPFKPVPPAELSVFDEAHPRPADALDAPALRARMTRDWEAVLSGLAPRDATSLRDYQMMVRTALRVMVGDGLPSPGEVSTRKFGERPASGGENPVRLERLLLSRGRGEAVPALALLPEKASGTVVVSVHHLGKRAAILDERGEIEPLTARLLASGASVVALDPFLTGEYHLSEKPTPLPAVNKNYAGYTFGYNRPLLAERVHDILTAVGYARDLPGTKRVRLVGLGKAGPWAILARALAMGAVERAYAEVGSFRFEEVKETSDEMMLPGALKYGGLPSFAALGAPHDLWAVAAPGRLDFTREAYRVAGAADHLQLTEERPDGERIAGWLLRAGAAP